MVMEMKVEIESSEEDSTHDEQLSVRRRKEKAAPKANRCPGRIYAGDIFRSGRPAPRLLGGI